jgi:hypothetical protein
VYAEQKGVYLIRLSLDYNESLDEYAAARKRPYPLHILLFLPIIIARQVRAAQNVCSGFAMFSVWSVEIVRRSC